MNRIDITDLATELDGTSTGQCSGLLRILVPLGEVVTAISIAAATVLTFQGHDRGRVTILVGIAGIGLLPYVARLMLALNAGLEIETKIRKRGRNKTIELQPGSSRKLGDIVDDLARAKVTAQRRLQRPKPPAIVLAWPVLLMLAFLAVFRFESSPLHLLAAALLFLFVVLLYYIPMLSICGRGGHDVKKRLIGLALSALLAFTATTVALYGFTEIYRVQHTRLDLTVVGLCPFIFFLLSRQLGYWESVSAEEALAADRRDPLLFLRAFEDENIAAGSEGILTSSGRNLLIPIEHIISRQITSYGPFIAIGDPNTRHITIGARRRQIPSHESWQDAVIDYMKVAKIIVMLAAQTQGTTWELRQIVENGLADKLLLVFPPIDHQIEAQQQHRFEMVRSCFAGTSLHDALLNLDVRGLRAVVVNPRTGPIAITSRAPTDTAYEMTLIIALWALLAEVIPPSTASRPCTGRTM